MNDTIAAIATALSASGIGIIRLSGEDAIKIADQLFISPKGKLLKDQRSHTLNYGYIVDPSTQKVIDEVLVSIMRQPNTYTKEDVVEINGHGGIIVMQKLLQLVLSLGARLAEPGEFTKRAFLNGRLDLSQAEAVIDIINAKTDMALKSSVGQLEGALSLRVKPVRQEILSLIAHIEASIDYPEYDIDDLSNALVIEQLDEMISTLNQLLETADNGKIIREGIQTIIVGKPNVGKSSLMNALLKERRAIVTDIPGTTRDTLEEYMTISGIPIKIIDTAGIRETEDIVEKIGVSRTKELIDDADLVIMMLDISVPISQEDYNVLELIKTKKAIVLVNKIDLNKQYELGYLKSLIKDLPFIPVSLKDNIGLEILEKTIKDMFLSGSIDFNQTPYITNIRHKHALEKAINSLKTVISSIQNAMPEDCWAIDLKNAYDFLGEIIGESMGDSIIDQIFSQFCLGK